MVNKGLDRLVSLREINSKNADLINKDLYRLLCKEEILTVAYNSIKSKPGNMTPGSDDLTLDAFSTQVVLDIKNRLLNQSYQFNPVRRVYIPKGNTGKMRPLGIPSPRDKVVHKAMLMILESIYEPLFSQYSHGFRPNKSCHTALRQIRQSWSGVKWAIEGDIEGCYDNVDHQILIKILRYKVQDERFLDLIWKMLRAGLIIDGKYSKSLKGTPQGGILSPLLSNIYLHELDVFITNLATEISLESSTTRRENPEYKSVRGKIYRLQTKRLSSGTIRKEPSPDDKIRIGLLRKKLFSTSSKDKYDPNYKKIIFVRYADDWVVGIIGSKQFSDTVFELIRKFLKEKLSLTLSQEKTKITLVSQDYAKFLGYRIQIGGNSEFSSSNAGVKRRTVGWHNIIIGRYNSIIRGYRNYYSPADNYGTTMNRIEYILKYSCAHTLAAKHRTRITVQLKKIKTMGLDISTNYKNKIWDFKIGDPLVSLEQMFLFYTRRTKLLSDTKCLICSSTDNLEMHHVKALRKDGVLLKDNYMIGLMQRMNRKQITVCRTCHLEIHQGKYDGNSISMLDSLRNKDNKYN